MKFSVEIVEADANDEIFQHIIEQLAGLATSTGRIVRMTNCDPVIFLPMVEREES